MEKDPKVQSTIRINQSTLDKIQRLVQEKDRSFNWIVNKAIEAYLEVDNDTIKSDEN